MATSHNEHLTFLNDRIPTWLTNLSSVTTGTEERLCETTLSKPSCVNSELRRDYPKLFSDSANANTFDTTKSRRLDGTQTPGSTKRKRAPSSTESYHRSACNRYRAQNAKVVFYDASAQKLLEKVVEDIGQVKNMIRKEKAMARVRSYGRPAAHSSDGDDDDDDLDDDTVMAQVRLRRKRTSDAVRSTSECSSTNMENLDRINKRLESAQDMCSSAAYQLLRDGDCRMEASRAAEQLEDIWVIVKDEMTYNEERSMEGCSRDPSSIEKEPSYNVRSRASVESEDDVPIAPIRLTSQLALP